MRSHLPALSLFLLLASGLSAAPRFHLVVVDSPGQPAETLAREAHDMTRDRRSRCDFRWLRVGSPDSRPEPAAPTKDASPPPVPPPAQAATPKVLPSLEPEWDPEGSRSAAWQLEGLPRILLIDDQDHVLMREVFLPRSTLRYLSRHPEGFSQPSATSRMGGTPPGVGKAESADP